MREILHTEGVEVQRKPFTGWVMNEHRRRVADHGDPVPVPGVVFAPGATVEQGGTVDSDATLYLPWGTEASEHDQWIVDGDTYEAIGIDRRWGQVGGLFGSGLNLFGKPTRGLLVNLRRVIG